MSNKRRHLFAALGFTFMAVLCFCLLTWALVEGKVVANFPGDASVRSNTAGHEYVRPNTVITREKNPGRYWLVVGFLGLFGSLFTIISILERRSYQASTDLRNISAPGLSLLAQIDRACKLYPESQETLLRARAAVTSLKNPAVDVALSGLLEKVLAGPDRGMALKQLEGLTKALDLTGC